ncbi:hypothetical protein M011DRAFT_101641 [Sporormia fimetaria CBS 119925]|uniref:Uncharacterized protein n=1 Tax=Sporormia fimetaria CBS 119925 TaxID=1340428 RepID=A0A6A6VPD6_9PLEO|nr:hypothetical protein M011DRAFT_101641 [Sporormia fimetaria CBS 119925]
MLCCCCCCCCCYSVLPPSLQPSARLPLLLLLCAATTSSSIIIPISVIHYQLLCFTLARRATRTPQPPLASALSPAICSPQHIPLSALPHRPARPARAHFRPGLTNHRRESTAQPHQRGAPQPSAELAYSSRPPTHRCPSLLSPSPSYRAARHPDSPVPSHRCCCDC